MIGIDFLHPNNSIPAEREIVLEWFQKLCLPSLNPRKKHTAMERAHLQQPAIQHFFATWLCQKENTFSTFTQKVRPVFLFVFL